MIYNTENEIWKSVKDYEGYYEVSNIGRVRSVDRIINTKTGTKYLRKGAMLNGAISVNGHLCVTLSRNNGDSFQWVHRLVAFAFIPLIDGKNVVNHLNGDKLDNRVENLEWCTSAENAKHAHKYLNMNYTPRGEKSPFAKPIIQKDKNGNIIKRWGSLIDAKRELNLNSGNLTRVLRGINKSHKGFVFEYEK